MRVSTYTYRRPKLLFVVDSLSAGGAERQLVELLKGLLETSLYELHLAYLMTSPTGYYHIIDSLDIRTNYFPRRCKYDLLGPLSRLSAYIWRQKIDLVHGFMNMGSLFGTLAAKITGKMVVCSALRDAKDTSWKDKWLKRLLAMLCDIYVSNTRAGFTNRFEKMKPHFRVVYNGIDLSRFEVTTEQITTIKKDLGLVNVKPIIGMVGSLSEFKDYPTFLRSARIIVESLPRTVFLIIGDGPRRPTLESLAESLNIKENVVFTGHRKDVELIYPIMDVCVLLTNAQIHLEGIPNVLLEAMASGVPVVGSEGGGTSELIQHGVTGFLVPPLSPKKVADAILELLANREERLKMGQLAKAYVTDTFALSRYVSDYQKIYQELLAGPRLNRYAF